ncbi:aspartate/glutamate racemase family protein [Peloplasma aerotolerans]|uniref:Aspartate/glutamate racemase family protein n=1 Tax=Peloplasma aerotolerans TaxID=3044389 RepID=A0AAW6U5Q7_9MOLU|nr:aspartate/glutamate racemase family protein [Mariniplasma sp. M4Ah]MDI6453195.1 aspartate/glutamate racemase family protein [Mariniplasma sp. M4Ah]
MKTIGLLGGMSWESTLEYYRLINLEVKRQLGGSHSAKILMYSFDYHELEILLEQNKWDEITQQLVNHGKKLKESGAEILLICANTMHIVADEVEKQVGIPLIHIAKATLNQVKYLDLTNVLLVGTIYTMKSTLYPNIFSHQDVSVIVPDIRDQAMIHRTIYHELILGIFSNESKVKFIEVINKAKLKGIQGVILGCTEIPMLIRQQDLDIPLFNTMEIQVKAAVDFSLND